MQLQGPGCARYSESAVHSRTKALGREKAEPPRRHSVAHAAANTTTKGTVYADVDQDA